MFYAFIEDNKLVGAGECRQLTAGVDNEHPGIGA